MLGWGGGGEKRIIHGLFSSCLDCFCSYSVTSFVLLVSLAKTFPDRKQLNILMSDFDLEPSLKHLRLSDYKVMAFCGNESVFYDEVN